MSTPVVTLADCRELSEDYAVDIQRPDGSIVSVLIPKEGENRHLNLVIAKNDPEKPFGLNLVSGGHYY